MWELTEQNAVAYLLERGLTREPPCVTLLAGGVSNIVLRVETGGDRFVLKQSRPQLRTREAWFSDVERIYREQEVMETLAPLLPGVVPRVLFSDRERFLFAMEHAPLEARNWKTCLLQGEVDPAVGERAGRILGRIHQLTGANPSSVERFADRTVFVQLRVDPFYQRIQERHPDLTQAIAPLVTDLQTQRQALCHGDFSPKNLLVHAGGLVLVDYETAHLGEPAMDLGFFFSHLLLKTLVGDRGRFVELVRSAWLGYAAEVRFESAADLLARGLGHLGVCLLARVDGTSPVDYLTNEGTKEAVRRLGRWLLRERPTDWDAVLTRLDRERPE